MMKEWPFYVLADSNRTVSTVKYYCNQIKDVKCVVIDYLGLMHSGDDKKYINRYEEMTNISGELKAMAKKLNIPIIVLAQLNRENMNTADKRPCLQHLRDSGAIEQDADCVILLHRPGYYGEGDSGWDREEIEVIVAKNRHAGTGTATLVWEGSSGRIIDYAA